MKILRKKAGIGERRFRASIYTDIFVPETDDLEADRETARKILEEAVSRMNFTHGEPYIGGIAEYDPRNLKRPFDREI